jgi:hypothetical protein
MFKAPATPEGDGERSTLIRTSFISLAIVAVRSLLASSRTRTSASFGSARRVDLRLAVMVFAAFRAGMRTDKRIDGFQVLLRRAADGLGVMVLEFRVRPRLSLC